VHRIQAGPGRRGRNGSKYGTQPEFGTPGFPEQIPAPTVPAITGTVTVCRRKRGSDCNIQPRDLFFLHYVQQVGLRGLDTLAGARYSTTEIRAAFLADPRNATL
jgi:hypothetical protein